MTIFKNYLIKNNYLPKILFYLFVPFFFGGVFFTTLFVSVFLNISLYH